MAAREGDAAPRSSADDRPPVCDKAPRRRDPLPRAVRPVIAGILVSTLGDGMAFSFLLVYLHAVRGFSLTASGLSMATIGATALVANPPSGALVDRFGPRAVLRGALVVSAVGWAGYAFVTRPEHALAAGVVAGTGRALFWPSQAGLLAALAPEHLLHRVYSVQYMTVNLGMGAGSVIAGAVVVAAGARAYTILFLAQAASFVLYLSALRFTRPATAVARPARSEPGYARVVRDRLFLRLLALSFLFWLLGLGAAELTGIYATTYVHLDEAAVGIFFGVNAVTIIVAQLPVARFVEGRSRMRCQALMGAVWALAWTIVWAAGTRLSGAASAAGIAAGMSLVGLGECIYASTQTALVVALAPPEVRGRYLAAAAVPMQLALVAGPGLGGFVLAVAGSGTWLGAAAIAAIASVAALRLERRLPPAARTTPVTAISAGPAPSGLPMRARDNSERRLGSSTRGARLPLESADEGGVGDVHPPRASERAG